jgi:chromosome segregation ATPase
MGKSSKKKLDARLSAAEAILHDLEDARAAQDEFVVSTLDELARFGEGLAAVRGGLETATGEVARLAATLRDRREHSLAVEAQLQEAKALGDVLEARALQAEAAVQDLQARVDELRLASAEELGAARGRERLTEDRLRTVQRQLSEALKRLRDAPVAADPIDVAPAEHEREDEVAEADGDDPGEDGERADPSGRDEEARSYERVWESFRREATSDPEEDAPGS